LYDFNKLHQQGKVLHFGVRNHNPMQTELLQKICEASEISLTREEWYQLYRAAGNELP
jgi:predicted oxidoreductase